MTPYTMGSLLWFYWSISCLPDMVQSVRRRNVPSVTTLCWRERSMYFHAHTCSTQTVWLMRFVMQNNYYHYYFSWLNNYIKDMNNKVLKHWTRVVRNEEISCSIFWCFQQQKLFPSHWHLIDLVIITIDSFKVALWVIANM